MLPLADHGTKHFGLEEEGCGVGPVPHRQGEDAAGLRHLVRLDAGERTGSCNAGGAGGTKFIAHAGIEGDSTERSFPLSIGRTGVLFLAGDVALVLDLERLHCAADVEFSLGLLCVSDAHVRKLRGGLIIWSGFVIGRFEVNDVELISDVIVHVEGAILLMAIVKDDRVSAANRFREGKDKET